MITEKELFDVYCHKGFSGILEEFNELKEQNKKSIEVLDYYANGSWDIGKRARYFLAEKNKENL